jgi:hypothetical protein
VAIVACIVALVLGFGAAGAVAQLEPAQQPDPGQPTVPTTTTNGTTPPTDGEQTITVPPTAPEQALEEQSEAAAPLNLEPKEQREQYDEACSGGSAVRFPTSGMRSARQGRVGEDGGSPVVVVVGLLAAVAAFGYLWRRFGGRGLGLRDKSALEVAGAVVALVAGLAGLGVQFVPGLGAREKPPPSASMEVRQVHARVPYESYARAVEGARGPRTRTEGRSLGNVAWIELRLTGYDGDDLALDWAEYNVDTGGALIPGTEGERPVAVGSDHETRFEPIWVGYPRSGRFQVQFRLLDEGGQVRAMTRTGPMRGTRFRYACRG